MKKTTIKILGLVLSLSILIGVLFIAPMTASAEGNDAQQPQATVTQNQGEIKDISNWSVVGALGKTYTGKPIQQDNLFVVDNPDSSHPEYATFNAEYSDNIMPGTAKIVITGTGNYKGTITKEFIISKLNQKFTVKAKAVTVKASKLKKKKVTVKNVFTVKNNKGKIEYQCYEDNIKLGKNGAITIQKGNYKKNKTLKVKVSLSAQGDSIYKGATKEVTVKIKIK